MTRTKSSPKQKTVEKKQITLEQIMVFLKDFGDDVQKIVKLNSKEKVVVNEFFNVLQYMLQQMFSLDVSTSGLPFRADAFNQAHIN